VGVNSAIFSPSGGNIGIGFAIPINLAKNIVKQLKDTGKVVRGWLGVVVQMVTPELADSFGLKEGKGALVADVEQGSPADKAGIKKGDIIIAYKGEEIKEMNELPLMVAETAVGEKAEVTIIRDGKTIEKKVTIGELQEEKTFAAAEGKPRMDMGMEVRELNQQFAQQYNIPEKKGVVVTSVEGNSPADMAGIREGDVIIEVDRKPVENLGDYSKAVTKAQKEGKVLLLIKRAGTSLFVVIKLN
jgi:serine protease Do